MLAAWHKVNVKGMDDLDVGATVNVTAGGATQNSDGTVATAPNGEVVLSVQKNPGATNYNDFTVGSNIESPNMKVRDKAIDGFLEWGASDAGTAINKSMVVDVKAYDFVYVILTSRVPFNNVDDLGFSAIAVDNTGLATGNTFTKTASESYRNLINDITVTNGISPDILQERDVETRDSSTWESYKGSSTNNTTRDFDEQRHFELEKGRRYGMSPEHSQDNGTFYIDNLRGFINFSSTMANKTIILDYISDSLGTDEEMKVHKFAEDALYKSIICDVMSTRLGVPEYAIARYKKDKKASRRTAKLRLSNIKLEDITQVFRNKSKHIKH